MDLTKGAYRATETQEAQLSLKWADLSLLVVTNLKGHPRSMIFMSFERAYATSYNNLSPISHRLDKYIRHIQTNRRRQS